MRSVLLGRSSSLPPAVSRLTKPCLYILVVLFFASSGYAQEIDQSPYPFSSSVPLSDVFILPSVSPITPPSSLSPFPGMGSVFFGSGSQRSGLSPSELKRVLSSDRLFDYQTRQWKDGPVFTGVRRDNLIISWINRRERMNASVSLLSGEFYSKAGVREVVRLD